MVFVGFVIVGTSVFCGWLLYFRVKHKCAKLKLLERTLLTMKKSSIEMKKNIGNALQEGTFDDGEQQLSEIKKLRCHIAYQENLAKDIIKTLSRSL